MGNRVKGRTKKKSIKAASHSGMGSKRKLSRMGKKQKKDHSGLDATFIGRATCLRRLQVSLKDFRRLCILKGIYPREPRGRAPKNKRSQVYYHIKDIRAIAHEPVLDKFREFRAFMKKVRRAAGRNEKDEAARRHALAPTYTLHHLVRERYPRFVDALTDIDDALTLIHLFAALPSDGDIRTKVTNKAKALAAAWDAYCSTTSSITKSFISVKGVYLEASIRGSIIRWIAPHSFTQMLPEEVDYKVMLTFFEFYETLLSFVLFKLYNELGLRYPLPVKALGDEPRGSTSSVLASHLKALHEAMRAPEGVVSRIVTGAMEMPPKVGDAQSGDRSNTPKKTRKLIKTVGEAISHLDDKGVDSDNEGEDEEDVDVAGPLKAALETMAEEEARQVIPGSGQGTSLEEDATKRKRLFAGLTFFLSREVPRGYLELVCLAYGGHVGWEGVNSPVTQSDPSITHHIVDRPKLPSSFDSLPKSREFIQPQWIIDSANFMFLLPIEKYSVGVTLPPHLSPWVDDEEEGYKPAYAEEIERLRNGESAIDEMEDDEEVGGEGMHTADAPVVDKPAVGADDGDDDDDDDDDDEEEDDDDEEMKDEDREDKTSVDKRKENKEETEEQKLARLMMSKKASRLYGRMQHGIAQKQAKAETLKKRRIELEAEKKTNDGKSQQKQKVERLKKERKNIENKYNNEGTKKKKKQKKSRINRTI